MGELRNDDQFNMFCEKFEGIQQAFLEFTDRVLGKFDLSTVNCLTHCIIQNLKLLCLKMTVIPTWRAMTTPIVR
jgi:hypothetical protein